MIKRIEVQTFLRYLGEGISQPAIVIGSDNNLYVLKTQRVKLGQDTVIQDCMYLNELLSYQIAKYLGVPVPEAAIAFLDQRLIDQDPSIMFVHRFCEGMLFASSALEGKEDNLLDNYRELIKMGKPYIGRTWSNFFDKIDNSYDIAKIIAFDILIANFDRYGNTGNLIVVNAGNSREVFCIDHGHAFFGPFWEIDKINCLKSAIETPRYINDYIDLILGNNVGFRDRRNANGLGEVFRVLEGKHIVLLDDLHNPFSEVVDKIEQISEDFIDHWMYNIPENWFVQKNNQISFYKKFILRQKGIVRYIIQAMAERGAFTNYRGGELQWKTKRQFGTA